MSAVYLTVDDAPSANLPQKVAVLEDHDVPALLFCEGRRLAEFPDRARRAVEAGYHLGNHTYSHRHASDLTVETFQREVDRTETLLEDVYDDTSVDRPARLFRFPYGDRGGGHSGAFQGVLAERGFVPPAPGRVDHEWRHEYPPEGRDWYWTVDVDDWNASSLPELRDSVEPSADRLRGDSDDVVLFHDDGNTVDLFEGFVDLLRQWDVAFGDPLDLLPDRAGG